MNYKQMTDFEINKAVATILGFDALQAEYRAGGGSSDVYCIGDGTCGFKNYCDRIEDAWPIIVENGICIEHNCIDHWGSTHESLEHYVQNANLLRATMIVFLKIKRFEQ